MDATDVSAVRVTLFRAAIALLTLALGCGPTTGSGVDAIRKRTARHGAFATSAAEVARTVSGVRYMWDVQAAGSWEDYRTDVIKAFTPDFRVVMNERTLLVLSQRTSGDAYRLELQLTASTPTAAVHVVLSATAD